MSDRPLRLVAETADSAQALAVAAAAGDRAAFEQLHARLSSGLLRHFSKRTAWDGELADELAQRTWSVAWQALCNGRYDPARAAFSTFLYAIGSKLWLQQGRSRRAAPVSMDHAATDMPNTSVDGLDPSELMEECELLDAMRLALRRTDGPDCLTPQERHIVTRASQGATDRALAAELGLAASTVNVRKQAAYAKLRQALARLGHCADSGERDDAANE